MTEYFTTRHDGTRVGRLEKLGRTTSTTPKARCFLGTPLGSGRAYEVAGWKPAGGNLKAQLNTILTSSRRSRAKKRIRPRKPS